MRPRIFPTSQQQLASDHKYLRICDLCKELASISKAHTDKSSIYHNLFHSKLLLHQFLESSCDTLRRVQTRPESSPKDQGWVLAIAFALILSISGLGLGWRAFLAHAQFVPAYAPSTNPVMAFAGEAPWHIGDSRKVTWPNGMVTQVTYRGEIPFGEMPPSWVQIGDMFKYGHHCWTWMIVPGESKPTWVDP